MSKAILLRESMVTFSFSLSLSLYIYIYNYINIYLLYRKCYSVGRVNRVLHRRFYMHCKKSQVSFIPNTLYCPRTFHVSCMFNRSFQMPGKQIFPAKKKLQEWARLLARKHHRKHQALCSFSGRKLIAFYDHYWSFL